MPESIFGKIAAAMGTGDTQALAEIAMTLAAQVERLHGIAEADAARKQGQRERTRRHRNGASRDVTLQDVTVAAGNADVPPSPPSPSLLPPTPPNNSSPTPSSPEKLSSPRKAAATVAASWVVEGSGWWVANVGAASPGRFGKALTTIVTHHGWPAVFPDLQAWVAERKQSGKPCRVEWYASEASARITAPPAPAMFDYTTGELTPYGERMTRPDRAIA